MKESFKEVHETLASNLSKKVHVYLVLLFVPRVIARLR